jgi:peptide/nickel transport system substrate-binding protein
MIKGAKWSDGQPITSADVKWSLDTLGGNGALFTGYTDNVTSVTTPDPETVVVKTKKPDARIVGGLFIYMLPKHIWGKQSVKALTTTYKPQMPMVGSGPYIVTEFKRNRLIRMEPNPNFRGPKPKFDELQWIKYGSDDAVERALTLGEIDVITEVQSASFERLGKTKGIKTVKSASPSFTELAFNLCSKKDCPDANFNPAIQDKTVRQAIGYSVDRERINEISTRTPRSRATASCRTTTRTSSRSRRPTTRTTRTAPSRCSTRPDGRPATAACARRAARSCRSTSTSARSRRRTSRTRGW